MSHSNKHETAGNGQGPSRSAQRRAEVVAVQPDDDEQQNEQDDGQGQQRRLQNIHVATRRIQAGDG